MNRLTKTRILWLTTVLLLLSASLPDAVLSQQSRGCFLQRQKQGSKQAAEVPVPAPRGKKLVMKDGTSHMARSYEVGGERVRYYSVERSAWEEIPAELVDWEATRQAEAEAAKQVAETEEKMRAAAVAKLASELDVDASIEVAPGIFLPEEEGLFVLQCPPGTEPATSQGRPATAASKPTAQRLEPRCIVLPLTQIVTDAKRDKTRTLVQIIVPIPIVPGRQKIVAAGNRAILRLSSTQPEFYIRTSDNHEPEMELIRAKVKGKSREIEFISTYITGDTTSKREAVSMQRWPVAKGVYRLTISQTLDPGEYVLAEYLPLEGMNLAVWDFGVDASPGGVAPANKPAAKKK